MENKRKVDRIDSYSSMGFGQSVTWDMSSDEDTNGLLIYGLYPFIILFLKVKVQ